MSEREWRGLGITMSPGWIHCGSHLNTPHILWFRRPWFQIHTPSVTSRKEKRPRLTKSAGDVPGLNASLPTVDSASTVLHMQRLVEPNPKGFEMVQRPSGTTIDLPLFKLSLKQPAVPRTVTLRSLQTRELLRLWMIGISVVLLTLICLLKYDTCTPQFWYSK